MIQIVNKENCCGCSACASICPKQCISMVEDNEGFIYPKADKGTCVNCGLCEEVCNELQPYGEREPLCVLAAINKNGKVRMKSSSGGIFYLLAEKTIEEGGVVFGARFDENWQVVIDYAEDMKGVEAFMGSKYVQARIANAYKDAKRFLADGRKVLFAGTPCQVAGLHKYLRKLYDNLLTVDFICHGVPSPKVWSMYLDEVVKEGKRISNVEFRNKEKGWKNFNFNLRYNVNDKTISMLSPFPQNHYMKAFLQDIILRPSCYACKAKGCSSLSDVTLADFWGIDTVFPNMDDDKGTSLVFVNTEKGRDALNFTRLDVAETTYERIKPLNPACYRSPNKHAKREEFFSRLGNENLISLIDDCTKPTFKKKVYIVVNRLKDLIKRIIKYKNGGGKLEKANDETMLTQEANSQITIPGNFQIVYVCFRNKDDGWNRYNIEIKLK